MRVSFLPNSLHSGENNSGSTYIFWLLAQLLQSFFVIRKVWPHSRLDPKSNSRWKGVQQLQNRNMLRYQRFTLHLFLLILTKP